MPQIPNDPNLECVTGFIYDGQTIESNTSGGLSYFDEVTMAHLLAGTVWRFQMASIFRPSGSLCSFTLVRISTARCRLKHLVRIWISLLFVMMFIPLVVQPLRHLGSGVVSVTNGPARDESIDYLYENNEQWYMIVVDAKNPQEDWFRLSVSCE